MNKSRCLPHISLSLTLSILLAGCLGGSLPAGGEPPSPSPPEPIGTETAEPQRTLPFTPAAYQAAVVGMVPGEVLAVHQGPDRSSPVIGTLPGGAMEISVSQGSDLEEDAWTLIQKDDLQGWVISGFLAEQRGTISPKLAREGSRILAALKEKQYRKIAAFIHPDQCLRFTPYPTLTDRDLTFCKDALIAAVDENRTYEWGAYDGTGDPIQLPFQEYHQRFIYDLDYFHADIVGYNMKISSGNAINNIFEIYPNAEFIEYHFPQTDSEYAGLDWRSLTLVFIEIDQSWYLAALVHGEWTI